tara:strand:- start:208 stop:924 length:717 start_codon:yes stop_codon:yes gene_type:complete
MTQPTVIDAQSISYSAVADSGNSRTYEDVVIPAEANTVIMLVGLGSPSGTFEWTDIAFGNAAAIKTQFIDVSSESPLQATAAAIFDVSEAGAMTADVVASLSAASTADSKLGIVCSTGFVESWATTNDRSGTAGQNTVFSPNYENNIFVLMGSVDIDIDDLTITTGTLIFKGEQGAAKFGVFGAKQTSEGSINEKTIAYTMSIEEMSEILVTLSTQRNPFATNFGPVIRPIIAHDVIS